MRRESAEWCESRAKLVRADFTQAIGEHWRNRRLEWNRLAIAVAWAFDRWVDQLIQNRLAPLLRSKPRA